MEEKKDEVEKKDQDASTGQDSDLLEKELAAKDAQIAKLAQERDNYKKGMLKAKGKSKDDDEDDSDEEDVDSKIDRKVKQALLDTEWMQAQKEKDDIIKKALARNKELETAIKNRSQIATAGAGSGNESKLVAKDAVLSEEKIKQFKSMGWDDKKIERYKQNLMKSI